MLIRNPMHNFTPLSALLGGGLIGIAASLLFIGNGRVAGISGIVGGLLSPSRSADWSWRVLFLGGLLACGAVAARFAPQLMGASPRSLPVLIVAGLLVGMGTRIGSGCTSGHGVCGISRLSARSLVATVTFIAAAMVTVKVFSLFGGVR